MSSHENICDGSGQVWLGSQPYGSPGESYAPCPGCPACRASGRQGCASRAPDIDPAPACVKYTGHLGPHVSEDGVWWVGRAVARWTMPSRQNSIASDTEAEMSDERRAEIEAVALAIYESRLHASFINGWSAEPEALRERFRKAAIAALDRLRDARGDDEGGIVYALRRAVSALGAAAVAFRKLDEGHGYPPHIAAGDAKRAEDHAREALRRYDREREAAWFPQSEDHEAGIEAARLKLPSAWRHDGTVDEGEALTRVMVAAYLSRVSAPKADEKQEAR